MLINPEIFEDVFSDNRVSGRKPTVKTVVKLKYNFVNNAESDTIRKSPSLKDVQDMLL